MPPLTTPQLTLLTASLLICEKILNESDSVLSLIRLVDVFEFVPPKDRPADQLVVPIQTVGIVKSDASLVGSIFYMELVRPDGEATKLGEDFKMTSDPPRRYPAAPLTFHLLASFAVQVRQTGRHYIKLYCNGQEIAKAPLTLHEKQERAE